MLPHMTRRLPLAALAACLMAAVVATGPRSVAAQTPPTPAEYAAYTGLHAAAAQGRASEIEDLLKAGGDLEARDDNGRTPLLVAAYRRDIAVAQALLEAGANPNALDNQSYDAVTIAAVSNDLAMLKLMLASGGNARAITSPYSGTALIASAHAGHVAVVEMLIAHRAPLDHVNNLGWTALIEAIVLGDGSERYQKIVAALIAAGADLTLADRNGKTPLALARDKGVTEIAALLEKAGAQP
jgi:ankyrin repeat protein